MTKPEAIKLMAVLRAAYPNQTITDETVEIYATMLADIEFATARDGVKRLLAESRFFPTIAEIRAAVVRTVNDLPAPEVAWGQVMAQVRAVGSYGRPEWETDALSRAVRAVGWESICQCELDQLNTLRSQFLRVYGAYRDHEERQRNLGSLQDGRVIERLPTGTDGSAMHRLGDIVKFERPRSEP